MASPPLADNVCAAEACTPPSSKKTAVTPLTWLVVCVVLASSCSGFVFGYEMGLIDAVLVMPGFEVTFGMASYDSAGDLVNSSAHDNITGRITAMFLAFAAVGAFLASATNDIIGRKRSLLLGAVIFIIGAAVQTGSYSLDVFLVGRAFAGCGIGFMSMTSPLYIAEVAPDRLRGRLVALQVQFITLGVFVASVVNSLFYLYGASLPDGGQWRGALGVQLIPAGILIALLLPLPFSPRWLGAQGRWEEASAVLALLRGVPEMAPAVVEELAAIRATCLLEDGTVTTAPTGVRAQLALMAIKWRALFSPQLLPRAMLVISLQAFTQASGINVVLYYASTLFVQAGAPPVQAATTLVIINSAVFCAFTLPGLWMLDVPGIGRRALLIWGAAAMSFFFVISCVLTELAGTGSSSSTALSYAGITMLFCFTAAFAATWGPAVWVVQSEVLPLRVRSQGNSIGTVTTWSIDAVIGRVSPFVITRIGSYIFLVFAGILAVACAYAYVAVPETSGVALEDMDELFAAADSAAAEQRQRWCGPPGKAAARKPSPEATGGKTTQA